jgi:acetyltransferase-like isoleucine patch superfamily enzyme
MTESEKMKSGLWYDANFDRELVHQRLVAEELCFDLNHTRPGNTEERTSILKKLIPELGENCTILSPFMTDYGCYCRIGHDTFINHNAYLVDGGGITIGHHCFIGPNCGMYTATHPLLAEERNQGLEKALPIVIGDNCWIGSGVTILPGVTIGSNAVIGAGSVVTKDIPENVIAIGNPCRVIRPITETDRIQKDNG